MKKTVTNGVKWSAGFENRNCVGENKTQDNMYDDMVRKLEFKFDIEKLKKALDQVLEISDNVPAFCFNIKYLFLYFLYFSK